MITSGNVAFETQSLVHFMGKSSSSHEIFIVSHFKGNAQFVKNRTFGL